MDYTTKNVFCLLTEYKTTDTCRQSTGKQRCGPVPETPAWRDTRALRQRVMQCGRAVKQHYAGG
jgi:hypothetical protein